MEGLSGELVFARTETGRAELASHALLADKPMQFLLLMINGKRDLMALRGLSQILQESDQPIFTLLEKNLIAPVAVPVGMPVESTAAVAPYPASSLGSDGAPTAAAAPSERYAAADQTQADTTAAVSGAEALRIDGMDASVAPATFETTPAEAAPAFAAPAARPDSRPDASAVGVVAALLQQVLGRDAEDMVVALKRIDSAGEFNASVRRLENMLRQNVSGGMAEELRARIPAAFE
jgi:hypothetical protein